MNLSICIPTYNRCDELARLIDSIKIALDQSESTTTIEVIVSDNASTDATALYMREAEKHTSWIHYYRSEKNEGFAKNLNKAVSMARGDYCWLMGSDDVLLPESIAKVLQCVGDGAAVIVGNPITNFKERKFFQFNSECDQQITSEEDYIRYLVSCREISSAFAFMSTLIVMREFWFKIECTEYEKNHPYTHMLRIIRGLSKIGGTVKCLSIPLVETGHAGNEYNTSVLPHFELDLLTINYIANNIYNSSMAVMQAYGGIFRRQYSIINLMKSRVECAPDRWNAMVPTLIIYGYPVGLLRKKLYDPILLVAYKIIKKFRKRIHDSKINHKN